MRTPTAILRSMRNLRRLWRREDGSSTVEFVIWFPFYMTLFLTSFELSWYSMRSMMLERALDLIVRDLRLAQNIPADLAAFKKAVCNETLMFGSCLNDITLDLRVVNSNTWNYPTGAIQCVDRANNIVPLTSYTPGAPGNFMVVRACVVKDPFFATTPYVMGLPRDPSGGVAVTAVAAFVVEP